MEVVYKADWALLSGLVSFLYDGLTEITFNRSWAQVIAYHTNPKMFICFIQSISSGLLFFYMFTVNWTQELLYLLSQGIILSWVLLLNFLPFTSLFYFGLDLRSTVTFITNLGSLQNNYYLSISAIQGEYL